MFKMQLIMNKKIEKIRGYKTRKNQKDIEPTFILFNDGETFIDLELQDYFTYHDCDCTARIIKIQKDTGVWHRIAYDDNKFGDANMDI